MPPEIDDTDPAPAPAPFVPDTPDTRAAIAAERKRVSIARDVGRRLRLDDAYIARAIDEGWTERQIRNGFIDEAADRQAPICTANPGASDPTWRSYAQPRAEAGPERGTNAARCMLALAATRGDPRAAADFVSRHYGRGGDVVSRALSTSIGSSGGFLVPAEMAGEVIELLRPASAVMSLGPRIVEMGAGNMLLPRVDSGATAAYVGENLPGQASQPGFGGVQLSAKKLMALVPISGDMIRFPSVSVDGIVRDDMVRAINQRGDAAMIRGNGSQWGPRGLKSFASDPALGGSNALAASPTVNLAAITSDLGRCELALEQANIPMLRPGWIMAPRTKNYLQNLRDGLGNLVYAAEMAGGRLRGKPFRSTTLVPTNLATTDSAGNATTDGSEIYLADFSEVLVGEALGLELKVFDGATYLDAGGVMQSGVNNDQVVMRAIIHHDLNVRHAQAVAMLGDVRWF